MTWLHPSRGENCKDTPSACHGLTQIDGRHLKVDMIGNKTASLILGHRLTEANVKTRRTQLAARRLRQRCQADSLTLSGRHLHQLIGVIGLHGVSLRHDD